MKITKKNPILNIINNFLIDSPLPLNISYFWNFGSLLGLNLIILIISGLSLAMHYTPNVDLAFSSVEHIMRDVNNGWILRYLHANGASFFFIWVYLHIGRGLFYGSYKAPRVLLWNVGVIIYILMMATAFIGYVLPWGQMSLWGILNAQNDTIINNCGIMSNIIIQSKIRSVKRIGPHNKNVLEYIYGSLLGDGFLERHGNGTRLCLQLPRPEYSHKDYLEWLHLYLSSSGLCPDLKIPAKGKNRYILRFKTWTYSNLNYLHEEWYKNSSEAAQGRTAIKKLPSNIAEYITPLSLAIWIMDDGSRSGKGLKLATNNFTYLECEILANILRKKFNLIVSIHKTGHINQWNLYLHKISIS